MLTINADLVTRTGGFDEFDVIKLENSIEEAYNAETKPYTDSEIEVDSSARYPNLYRVWCGRRQLGTFFRSYLEDDCWFATAFYKNGRFAEESEPESFETHQEAQNYIVQAYFG